MNLTVRRACAATLAAAALAPAVLPAAESDTYPSRPIRLAVPFPPGGGTDLVSRTMHPAFSAALGQQIVIDNRGGAQGLLGTAKAIKEYGLKSLD